MKIILPIWLFIFLLGYSCKKESQNADCKTCEVKVKYKEDGQVEQNYIESSSEYCDGGWSSVTQGTTTTSGILSGKHWSKTKTTSCH